MGRKKCSDDNGGKKIKKAVRSTIDLKKKIIAKFEAGTRVADLVKEFDMPRTTIASIIKKKDAIKSAEVAEGVTILSSKRSPLIENMEKLLLVWITEKQMAGDSISEAIICEKAKSLFQDLQKDDGPRPSTRADDADFKASSGWFRNFKSRTGIHRHGEAASSNAELAKQFVIDIKNFLDAEEYVPQEVFNCDETGLFWKMPRRTYITKEESSHPKVPDLNERLGMDGSSSSGKIEGASSSFLTCSPLISSMPGIHEDVLSSGAGPSSSVQNSNENDGDYDEDMIDVKTEPVFNVESEICEEENSQSNTQSSSDRRSHQSSPTPSMIGPYLLKKETHCTTILDQLLRDDTFSDVTLTAEGQSIRAHKIVLCLASAYFRQVLSKESNVQNVIVFRDVKFSELKNLINFIYTGEATVDAADLESFMKTAEMLEVTSLCDGQRNFPKNLLPKTKESESEKVPSTTPSKTFPATKRSHAFTSAANNGSPPTKSRKTDAKDTSKKSSLVLPHPSTSGGGGGTSCPNDSVIEPTATIIKTEPVSEDSVAEEDYELKVGTDVSFESLTRSPPPPPLAPQKQVSTDLGENQSSLPDQSACSSMSLEKVPVGKCPLCPSSQPIRKGSELTKHLYAHHPDKTVFCCESCSRVFLKKGSFEAHKNDCNR